MRNITRSLMAGLSLAAYSPAGSDPARAQTARSPIAHILVDAEVRTVAERQMVWLGVIREAKIEQRCDLLLQIEEVADPITIPLNNLMFVQGDDYAMLDIA